MSLQAFSLLTLVKMGEKVFVLPPHVRHVRLFTSVALRLGILKLFGFDHVREELVLVADVLLVRGSIAELRVEHGRFGWVGFAPRGLANGLILGSEQGVEWGLLGGTWIQHELPLGIVAHSLVPGSHIIYYND